MKEWTDFWFNLGLVCGGFSLVVFYVSKLGSVYLMVGVWVCLYLDIKSNDI